MKIKTLLASALIAAALGCGNQQIKTDGAKASQAAVAILNAVEQHQADVDVAFAILDEFLPTDGQARQALTDAQTVWTAFKAQRATMDQVKAALSKLTVSLAPAMSAPAPTPRAQ